MSDYTPTTEEVREIYFQSGYKTTPEQFDRWLAEELRKAKADAWEEGYGTGWGDGNYSSNDDYNNPYRQGEEQ